MEFKNYLLFFYFYFNEYNFEILKIKKCMILLLLCKNLFKQKRK